MEKLKVRIYVINKGQANQYYGLKHADGSGILTSAPNNWKFPKSAARWALKHDMILIED